MNVTLTTGEQVTASVADSMAVNVGEKVALKKLKGKWVVIKKLK